MQVILPLYAVTAHIVLSDQHSGLMVDLYIPGEVGYQWFRHQWLLRLYRQ
jgi:hypothetical protein